MFRKKISRHRVIMRLLKISDDRCICNYHTDPVLSQLPSPSLQELLFELEKEGYLKKNVRHVVLRLKAYEYPSRRRNEIIQKLFRPVSSFVSWAIGILSAVLIRYLIDLLDRQP